MMLEGEWENFPQHMVDESDQVEIQGLFGFAKLPYA